MFARKEKKKYIKMLHFDGTLAEMNARQKRTKRSSYKSPYIHAM